MKIWAVSGLFIGALIGCAASTGIDPSIRSFQDSSSAIVNWGQRLRITNASVVKARVNYLNQEWQFGLTQNSLGQKTFNVVYPQAAAPALPLQDPIGLDQYTAILNPVSYNRRGSVKFLDANGEVIEEKFPFGVVSNDRVGILVGVKKDCAEFLRESSIHVLEGSLISFRDTTTSSICYATAINTDLATDDFIVQVTTRFSQDKNISEFGYEVDKDTIFSLNQPGPAYSYDPTCDEIKAKIDPISNSSYRLIDNTRLRADVVSGQTSFYGDNVNVFLLGGGVGVQDQFNCNPYNFSKHDTHIAAIVKAIAPNSTVKAFRVCDSTGLCYLSNIAQAIMEILKANPLRPSVINMSLSGPNSNKILFKLIELLDDRNRIPIIASGGNTPNADDQFPASYSATIADSSDPASKNVISVAAVGLKNGGYRIAGFNTRDNADFFAPGVNLCPPSVFQLGIVRCDPAQRFPNNIGVTGSSFAAPVLTGLVALYMQSAGGRPQDLRGCIRSQLLTDAVTQVQYVALNEALLTTRPCQR